MEPASGVRHGLEHAHHPGGARGTAMKMKTDRRARILIVVTSHGQLGTTGRPTGFWLEELAVPYQIFTRAGVEVDIASPQGGTPPVDPASEKKTGEETQAFRADVEAAHKLAATKRLRDVDVADYRAVFVAG